MKGKWARNVMILLAVVMPLLMLGRKSLTVRIAPKAVLYSALTKTMEQLQRRFENSLVDTLLEVTDTEGKYTAEVLIQPHENKQSASSYEVKIQTNAVNNQIAADATIISTENSVTLSCYVDPAYIALASDKLGNSNYYGITFSSFSDDIRSIPLLDFFISDKMIFQWNNTLLEIPLKINSLLPYFMFSSVSEQNFDNFVLGVLALPCEVERISLPTENEIWNCETLTYSFKGSEINHFMQEKLVPETSEISVCFYLYRYQLVKVLVKYAADEQNILCEGFFGTNPLENDLRFTANWMQHSAAKYCVANVTKITDDAESADRWDVQLHEESDRGAGSGFHVSYDGITGNMALDLIEKKEAVLLNIQRFGEGFQIRIEDVPVCLKGLGLDISFLQKLDESYAEIFVYRGEDIRKPQYKNLDEWSLDDFWMLLTEAGSLLGIQILN